VDDRSNVGTSTSQLTISEHGCALPGRLGVNRYRTGTGERIHRAIQAAITVEHRGQIGGCALSVPGLFQVLLHVSNYVLSQNALDKCCI
jgi:hypothetical protein